MSLLEPTLSSLSVERIFQEMRVYLVVSILSGLSFVIGVLIVFVPVHVVPFVVRILRSRWCFPSKRIEPSSSGAAGHRNFLDRVIGVVLVETIAVASIIVAATVWVVVVAVVLWVAVVGVGFVASELKNWLWGGARKRVLVAFSLWHRGG